VDDVGRTRREVWRRCRGHVSYTHLSANFYVSLKDLNRILDVVFMPDDEFEKMVNDIISEIS